MYIGFKITFLTEFKTLRNIHKLETSPPLFHSNWHFVNIVILYAERSRSRLTGRDFGVILFGHLQLVTQVDVDVVDVVGQVFYPLCFTPCLGKSAPIFLSPKKSSYHWNIKIIMKFQFHTISVHWQINVFVSKILNSVNIY